MVDEKQIQQDFPQLKRKIDGKRIIYLDSTATSLKPLTVIDKEREYYTKYNANIFRGIYTLSEEATAAYEDARAKVAAFIGASSPDEIVFTRNATESINVVAKSWGPVNIKAGDHVVTTIMEHHSNFVPWQQMAVGSGIVFDIWDVDQHGQLPLSALDKLVTSKTRLVALTACSNVLGTVPPVKLIAQRVKTLNPHCMVLVDGAQAVPHMPVDVHDWGADFVVFSSHKMLGPTGVGVLWAKKKILEDMPPFLYGGEMISEVYRDKTHFKAPPHKFEAGTPHIAGVIGLGAAVDYLSHLGMDAVRNHQIAITSYALSVLKKIDGLVMYGPADAVNRGGVISFTMKGAHPHDIAQVLNEDNICIRAGNHCAMPLHVQLGLAATARCSFYVYTGKDDVDALVEGLLKIKKMFA